MPSCFESSKRLIYWIGPSLYDLRFLERASQTHSEVCSDNPLGTPQSIQLTINANCSSWIPPSVQIGEGRVWGQDYIFSAPWTAPDFSWFCDPHLWKTFHYWEVSFPFLEPAFMASLKFASGASIFSYLPFDDTEIKGACRTWAIFLHFPPGLDRK